MRGISFDVAADRTVALVGESGSGKSVSAMAVLGLLPDNARVAGSIRFEGRELTSLPQARLRELRGSALSVVFQEPMSSLNPVWRAPSNCWARWGCRIRSCASTAIRTNCRADSSSA